MTGASALIALLALASAAGALNAEPRPTITRESIRRAVLPIDRGPAAASTQSDTDWRSVSRVKAGADIRVILDDWKRHRGRFQSVDDRSITLEIDGVNRTMPRAQVRQIDARGGARAGNAKAWAAAGMLGGSAVGAASCRGEESECVQRRLFTSMALGTVAGAILGAALPSWRSIYAVRP